MKKVLKIVVIVAALLMGWSYWYSNYSTTGRAWNAVHMLADAIIEHHDTYGRWPQNLDDIDDPALIEHKGVRIVYDPDKLTITLPMYFEVSKLRAILTSTVGYGNFGVNGCTK